MSKKKEILFLLIAWILSSLIWFFARYFPSISGLKDQVWLDVFLTPLLITILLHFLFYSFKSYLETPFKELSNQVNISLKNRITISEKLILNDIHHITPLYNHYSNFIDELPLNLSKLKSGEKVIISPFEIYSHILSAAQYFKDSIFSVDCDIAAWENICEFEDYLKYNSGLQVDREAFEKLKKQKQGSM